MKRSIIQFSLLLCTMTIALSAAASDPSLHEVYQAVQAGKLKEAQVMMDQVLRDHPNSAKAHFVEAEIQAKQGSLQNARTELAAAERLAPGLPFAKPAAIEEIKALTSKPQSSTLQAAPVSYPTPSFPWGLVLGGLALLGLLIYFIRSRQQAAMPYSSASATGSSIYPQPAGINGGFGNQVPMAAAAAPGIGSGIMGSLATGAAVGVGMVAGEALMHRVFDGSNHEAMRTVDNNFSNPNADTPAPGNYDAGGNDFGVSDAGSWDDSSGSDDWG
jgi:hypothetical protein